jgi:energy-coupling factor transporter ATP-binding protein EcfA2
MGLEGVPPFTKPVEFKFDQRVNLFVGPNASGKSAVLQMLADCLIVNYKNTKRPISHENGFRGLSICHDDVFDDLVQDLPDLDPSRTGLGNVLSLSDDWPWEWSGTTQRDVNPAAVSVDSVREGLPGVSDLRLEDYGTFGKTVDEILEGPFSGLRWFCAYKKLADELLSEDSDFPEEAPPSLWEAMRLADRCSRFICGEVIIDSETHNYIPGPGIRDYLHSPQYQPDRIRVLRTLAINTNDPRNFENLSASERPAYDAYDEPEDSVPIYLGHLSSGTEGTLLWIRWLALKMLHHHKFEKGWEKQQAILLIDEIENHLHPTWQRRVIPALLEHFPQLQIFATTHSPFVVAGLKAGQVHQLRRDEHGNVTAHTNTEDIIGWTADEICRKFLDVIDPTDAATAEAAEELRKLRNEGPRPDESEEEQRQLRIQELRQRVNRDLLASGPAAAQRELFEQNLAEILEEHRRAQSLNQDGE